MWLYLGNFSLRRNSDPVLLFALLPLFMVYESRFFLLSFMNHVFFCSAWQPTLLFTTFCQCCRGDAYTELESFVFCLILTFFSFFSAVSYIAFISICLSTSFIKYLMWSYFTPLSVSLLIPDMAVTLQRFFVRMKLVTVW